jgi:hydroxymethylbilane synthase
MKLRIATRRSPLAMWQSEHVRGLLTALDPTLVVELVPVETRADQRLDIPIWDLGGKGAFCTEVQAMVLAGHADLAVHSAKDLPARTRPDLVLAAVPERGEVRDALVGCRLTDLPSGATVATGSNRRRVQLLAHRPDLRFEGLRGNIGTRLAKAAGFDAIVMASVALERLGEQPPVVDRIDPAVMVPQVGQGALAIETRADDPATTALVRALEHRPSRRAVDAERAFLATLGGDCDLPAGAWARLDADGLVLDAVLAPDAATPPARTQVRGDDGDTLGREAATTLLDRLGGR